MPDQLVGQRAGDPGEVEAHRPVLQHREVPHLEAVLGLLGPVDRSGQGRRGTAAYCRDIRRWRSA